MLLGIIHRGDIICRAISIIIIIIVRRLHYNNILLRIPLCVRSTCSVSKTYKHADKSSRTKRPIQRMIDQYNNNNAYERDRVIVYTLLARKHNILYYSKRHCGSHKLLKYYAYVGKKSNTFSFRTT